MRDLKAEHEHYNVVVDYERNTIVCPYCNADVYHETIDRAIAAEAEVARLKEFCHKWVGKEEEWQNTDGQYWKEKAEKAKEEIEKLKQENWDLKASVKRWHRLAEIEGKADLEAEVERLRKVLETVRKVALVDQIDIAAFDAALTSIILTTGNALKRGQNDGC